MLKANSMAPPAVEYYSDLRLGEVMSIPQSLCVLGLQAETGKNVHLDNKLKEFCLVLLYNTSEHILILSNTVLS